MECVSHSEERCFSNELHFKGQGDSSPEVTQTTTPRPNPKSNPLPVFLNKVLLESGLAQSFTHYQ